MLQHYSHVRLEAKRNALDTLTMNPGNKAKLGSKIKGYDTSNDTNDHIVEQALPQVVDLMVELSGIEPLASSLRTRRSPS
jgi:hypothetical protein